MDNLIAYTGNDPQKIACALFSSRRALYWPESQVPNAWSVGHIQNSEVLLRGQPSLLVADLDLYSALTERPASAVMGLVARGKNKNTEGPYRFKNWLFGAHGEFGDFSRIREKFLNNIPEFLRRNIHSDAPSEAMFFMFLAFLHDANLLNQHSPNPKHINKALQQTILLFVKLCGSKDFPKDAGFIATNGRCLVADAHSSELNYLPIEGISDCRVCHAKLTDTDARKIVPHNDLCGVFIRSDSVYPKTQTSWKTIAAGSALLADANYEATVVKNI